ncbi:hypothetical protein C8R47DRAFT_1083233 [Mycena vitilis]|nr:hypothetical protein C8R47DRAFT_1083233 [Mycena vitilis]
MTQFMRYLAVAEEADPALLGSTQNPSVSSSGPAPIPSTASFGSQPPSGAPISTPAPTTTPTPARTPTPGPAPMDTRVPTPVPSTPPPAPPMEDVRPPATPPPPPFDDTEGGGQAGREENEDGATEDDPLRHLTDVGSPLKRAVAKLQGDAKMSRIWELERASNYHRIRETNIARNNKALAALGLQQEMRDLLKDVGEGREARNEKARKTRRAHAPSAPAAMPTSLETAMKTRTATKREGAEERICPCRARAPAPKPRA